ncbi:C-type mannose receptor 2-like isoform X2 [Vanacampus margaritifer]
MRTRTPAALLMLVLFCAADGRSTCDMANGWDRHGSSCYKKMKAFNGWLGARHHCVWEGGDLVSLTSADQETFVKEQMGYDTLFWIGLSNLKCDRAWCQYEAGRETLTWSNARVTATYANWDGGHVGSTSPDSSKAESCAYILNGRWRRGPCTFRLTYMCERSLNDCPDGRMCSYKDYGYGYNRVDTFDCDAGGFLYGDSCYYVGDSDKTWQASEDFCQAQKGHLASVHSEHEAKFLADHIGLYHTIGLRRNINNSMYEWSDGTPTDWIRWLFDNHGYKREDCVSLSYSGQFVDFKCNYNSFICKKENIRRSLLWPPGWSDKCGWWWVDNPSNDFCYLMGRKPIKTWKEARDECVRRQGDLLSITDSHEQAFIQGLLAFLPRAPSLWLGAYVTIAEDGGKWTDGSPLSYVHLNADNPGDPPGGRCLSLLTANGRWKVDDCQKKSGYICKRRGKGKTPEPPRPHDGFMERLVCQNSPPNLWCLGEDQDERVIRIQSAFYGRRSGSVCPAVGGSNGSCTVEGVLSHYRRHCDKRRKCHIALLKETTCPAVSKYLEMVYSCEQKVCLDSLGVANRSIADWQFKASSSMSAFTPEKARLNGKSCWKPSEDANGSWIQVELDDMRKVTGIVTEGCSEYWGFKLEMKLSVDGRTWATHPDGQFIGGGTRVFGTPVSTKYIRILPLEVGVDFGLRFDILGCALDDAAACGRKFNSLHFTNWKIFHCPPECANANHKVFGTLIYDEDPTTVSASPRTAWPCREGLEDGSRCPARKSTASCARWPQRIME